MPQLYWSRISLYTVGNYTPFLCCKNSCTMWPACRVNVFCRFLVTAKYITAHANIIMTLGNHSDKFNACL